MLTIGIDVGVTGAVALISDGDQIPWVFDLPIMTFGKAKWIDAPRLIGLIRVGLKGQSAKAFVEHLTPMPPIVKNGKSFGGGSLAAYSKGLTLGSTLTALQVAGVPFELITPSRWKRALGLIDPEATDQVKKLASLSRARMLFPRADLRLQKHHNRAEALLLAHYGQNRATLVPQKIVRAPKASKAAPLGPDLFESKEVA